MNEKPERPKRPRPLNFPAMLLAVMTGIAPVPASSESGVGQTGAVTYEHSQTTSEWESGLFPTDRRLFETILSEYIPARLHRLNELAAGLDPSDRLGEIVRGRLRAIEAHKNDHDYARGLFYLIRAGMDPSRACALLPDVVADYRFIEGRIRAVPLEVHDIDFFTDEYFDPKDTADFDFVQSEAFKTSVTQTREMGLQLSMDGLRGFSQLRSRIPDTQRIFTELSNYIGTENTEHLLLTAAQGQIPDDVLMSPSFVSSVAQLWRAGIDISTLFPGFPTVPSISREKLESSTYIEALIQLKKWGFKFSEGSIADFDMVLTQVPDGMENIRLLKELKVLTSVADISRYRTALQVPTIGSLLNTLVNKKGDRRSAAEGIILNVRSSDDVSFVIQTLGTSRLDNLTTIRVLAKTSSAKLSDPLYKEYLAKFVQMTDDEVLRVYKVEKGASVEDARTLISWEPILGTHSDFACEVIENWYMSNVTHGEWKHIRGNLRRFATMQQDSSQSPVVREIVQGREESVYIAAVIAMGREREPDGSPSSYETRLRDISGLDVRALFKLVSRHGVHGWTSTQQLLIDGYHIPDFENFSSKSTSEQDEILRRHGDHLPLFFAIRRDYPNAYHALRDIQPSASDMVGFLEILAQNGKANAFFDLVGDTTQKSEVITKFLLGLDTVTDQKSKVTGIVEVLHSLSWEGVRVHVLRAIESEVARLQHEIAAGNGRERMKDALLWYELIVAQYHMTHPDAEKSSWAQDVFIKYAKAFPESNTIHEEILFPNATSIGYSLFFNNLETQSENLLRDRDGHRALELTVEYYGGHISFDTHGEINDAGGGENGWKIQLVTDNTTGNAWKYVLMTKVDPQTKRMMVEVMNSPKMSNREIVAFYKHMISSFTYENVHAGTKAHGVQRFTLRGHGITSITDTALSTLKALTDGDNPDIPLVDIGVCGGFKLATEVGKISPTSSFSARQGTGMGDVTVRIQSGVMDYVLRTGSYDSRELQGVMNERFSKAGERMKLGYRGVRWPHTMLPLQVHSAFEAAKQQGSQ